MANEPSYTNVRMDANSPLGQWWRHQSDRDYSMQVLVQLANQKFGKNVDLKAYSLQQMINSNVNSAGNQSANQPADEPAHISMKETNHVLHQTTVNQLETHQPVNTDNAQPESSAGQPTEQPSDNNHQDLIQDALFGGNSKPQKKTKPGKSFRDQL